MELEKILEEIENERTSYEAKHVKSYEKGLRFAADVIRKHMNDGWIPAEERLPEGKVNPVSQDFYEYQVTAKFGNVKDVRHYRYGNGHWWHGPGIVDQYVIAWKERPEPYRTKKRQQEWKDNFMRKFDKRT